MNLRVYIEDLEDGGRQAVVGYVRQEGEALPRTIDSVVQQADPEKAVEAVAALIAAGLHAAAHVDGDAVAAELGKYEDALAHAERLLFAPA